MIWTEGSITLCKWRKTLCWQSRTYIKSTMRMEGHYGVSRRCSRGIQGIFQLIKGWGRTHSAVGIKKWEVWITWQWEAALSVRILEVSARGAQAKPETNQREWLPLRGKWWGKADCTCSSEVFPNYAGTLPLSSTNEGGFPNYNRLKLKPLWLIFVFPSVICYIFTVFDWM